MKHNTKFYLEKRKNNTGIDSPILMFVSFGGKRLQYYTGCRCGLNQWLDEITKSGEHIQCVKRNSITPAGESFSVINNKLDSLKNEVDKIFNRFEALNIQPTVEALRIELDKFLEKKTKIIEPEGTGFFDRYEQYKKEINISEGRKRHIQTNINKLKAFRADTTFQNLDVQFLIDFQNHLLNDPDLSKNTVIGELKILRTFLKYAYIKRNWTTSYPFAAFSLDPEVYGDPVFITIEERDKLYSAKIKEPYLQRVRDMFVFQCFIGCRVGDLVKLKKSNIVDGCIQYIAGKTKDDKPKVARIPLTEKSLSIIAKYDLPNGDLLPYITGQRYNEYIKKLFKKVKINRIVTIRDPKTGEGKQVSISDVASSHMARRCFVGNLYDKDVKNEIIASMSGHSPESKSFKRYHDIKLERLKEAIKMIE